MPPIFDDSRGKWATRGIYNWWKHGIFGGNGTNSEFISKLGEFLLSETGFLGLLKH